MPQRCNAAYAATPTFHAPDANAARTRNAYRCAVVLRFRCGYAPVTYGSAVVLPCAAPPLPFTLPLFASITDILPPRL